MFLFIGSRVMNQPIYIDGINLWEHDWSQLTSNHKVIDPLYGTEKEASCYLISSGKESIVFYGLEFSENLWGFFVEVNHPTLEQGVGIYTNHIKKLVGAEIGYVVNVIESDKVNVVVLDFDTDEKAGQIKFLILESGMSIDFEIVEDVFSDEYSFYEHIETKFELSEEELFKIDVYIEAFFEELKEG